MPRFLWVIAAPRQVFRNPGEHGVFTLLNLLLFEFVLIYPSAVTTCIFRLVGAPGHAIWSFLLAFYGYAIAAVFAVLAGGWMLYFAGRAQKQRVAPWQAASALSYAWAPHVLVVCVGAILTACDLRWPVFPQVRDVALPPGSLEWWVRQALHWLPMGLWTVLAARTLLNPAPDAATPATPATSATPSTSAKAVGGCLAAIMLAAPVATAAHVWAHWNDLRPVQVGSQLPHFQVAGVNRDDLESDGLLGQVVLINFWATWCEPCVAEMPRLQSLHDIYHARGLALVGLNIEFDNLSEVKTFIQSRGLSLPIYTDWGGQVQERFGVHTYPVSFLVDRHGVVAHVYYSPPDEAELRSRVEALLLP